MKKWAIRLFVGFFIFTACGMNETDENEESKPVNQGNIKDYRLDEAHAEQESMEENVMTGTQTDSQGEDEGLDIPVLRDFSSESFSTAGGDILVNYDESDLVLLPMYETVNKALLAPIHLQLSGETTLTLAVFGKVSNVKVGYLETPEDPGLWFPYGDVENVFIEASVNLPYDTSSIVVIGNYMNSEGVGEALRIILSDVKDTKDYEIIIR